MSRQLVTSRGALARRSRPRGACGWWRLVLVLLTSNLVSTSADGDEGPWFREVSQELGIDFIHQDARFGEKYYIETAASGGGFLDVDGDGDLDVYLIDGAPTPGSKVRGTPHNRLFENRDGRFVDITEVAGVGDTGYGMGMCVGDIDADGQVDFLVTNYGPDRLYQNRGGRFDEIGEAAGVADTRWSASCAFGDVDGDGDLDLYVTHYVDFAFDRNPFCGDRARNLRAYCRPEAFDGVTDSLFINLGDGRFRDEVEKRGIARGVDEKGFGVLMSDVDGDGDLDLYVANDGTMNRLYINDGKGFFRDEALLSGTGLSALGRAESGMGLDLGDTDGDGRMDLYVTNYSLESNTLYRNLGDLLFDDVTRSSGLEEVSYKDVGWGVQFFDFDRDGDLDLAIANGHAVDNIEIFEAGLRYRQANRLLSNQGGGRFVEAPAAAGEAWKRERVSRGLAVGDVNNDGRPDLLVTNTNDPVDLLLNELDNGYHWLGLVLRGSAANPLAIGARIELRAGDRLQVREVRSGGSFLAQGDLRQLFGLGRWSGEVTVEVRWPDGRTQQMGTSRLDRYLTLSYSSRGP